MAKKQSMKNQRLAEEVLSMERGLAAPFIAANPIRSLPGVIKIKLMEKMSKPIYNNEQILQALKEIIDENQTN